MKNKRIYTPEQKERKRLYDIEYRKQNADKIKERGKNRDKTKKSEYDKKYFIDNIDKVKKYREEKKIL